MPRGFLLSQAPGFIGRLVNVAAVIWSSLILPPQSATGSAAATTGFSPWPGSIRWRQPERPARLCIGTSSGRAIEPRLALRATRPRRARPPYAGSSRGRQHTTAPASKRDDAGALRRRNNRAQSGPPSRIDTTSRRQVVPAPMIFQLASAVVLAESAGAGG
jgi:hypothetical protein